jgi:iron complex transport system permease protein
MDQGIRTTAPDEPGAGTTTGPAPGGKRFSVRLTGLLISFALLGAVLLLSIGFGARFLSVGEVWAGLVDPSSDYYRIVHEMRLPRTLLGLMVGMSLGLAGAIMQALTRNPLADPGLLGINAGASAGVASAAVFFGIGSFYGYIWFALGGAAVVTALVYAVGGGRSATPARLALAGAALNATLYSYVSATLLSDSQAIEKVKFWTAGSLASSDFSTITRLLPFFLAGLAIALLTARPLNALSLGDDAARALGARPAVIRTAVIVAVTLLCGGATAACGPIVFVGLLVPHMVRPFTGPDLRWLLPYTAVLAPVLLLGSDVLGRVLGSPGELQVGTVTAVLGGPLFLYLVRAAK